MLYLYPKNLVNRKKIIRRKIGRGMNRQFTKIKKKPNHETQMPSKHLKNVELHYCQRLAIKVVRR
jgi:hypothetical protein